MLALEARLSSSDLMGIRVPAKTHAPLIFAGLRSAAEQWDQSSKHHS